MWLSTKENSAKSNSYPCSLLFQYAFHYTMIAAEYSKSIEQKGKMRTNTYELSHQFQEEKEPFSNGYIDLYLFGIFHWK